MTRAAMLLLALLATSPGVEAVATPQASLVGHAVVTASNGYPLEITLSATLSSDGSASGLLSLSGYSGASVGGNYHGKWRVSEIVPPGDRPYWCIRLTPLVTPTTYGDYLFLVEDRGDSTLPASDRIVFLGPIACADVLPNSIGWRNDLQAGDFVAVP